MEPTAGTGPVRRGLFTRQTLLDPDGGAEWVHEADVVLHPPDVERLALGHFSDAFRRRAGVEGARWVRLHQYFELPLLTEGRRFTAVEMSIVYATAPAKVVQVDPGRRVAAPGGFVVGVDAAQSAAVGSARPEPRPDDLEPRSQVTVWGQGADRVRWRFDALPGAPIRAGDGLVRAVVEIPEAATAAELLVDCTVTIERVFAGDTDLLEPGLQAAEVFHVELCRPL